MGKKRKHDIATASNPVPVRRGLKSDAKQSGKATITSEALSQLEAEARAKIAAEAPNAMIEEHILHWVLVEVDDGTSVTFGDHTPAEKLALEYTNAKNVGSPTHYSTQTVADEFAWTMHRNEDYL